VAVTSTSAPGLRKGSVLDVLCPQTKTVTVEKPAQAVGRFRFHSATYFTRLLKLLLEL